MLAERYFPRFDGFTLDVRRRCLSHDGNPVPLRPKEFDLLAYLIRSYPQSASKDDLIARVWFGKSVADSALSQTVYRLRRALGRYERREYVATIPGRGYQFVGIVDGDNTVSLRNGVRIERHRFPAGTGTAAPRRQHA